jgi:hypothetical protein
MIIHKMSGYVCISYFELGLAICNRGIKFDTRLEIAKPNSILFNPE